MDLYREIILDHYQNPHHHGKLDSPDATYYDVNTSCGDEIRMDINVGPDGRITDVGFSGHGCAISQASASLLSDQIIGMPVDDVLKLGRQDVLDNLGGITLTPVRLKCALLGLGVLKAAIYTYKGQKPVPEESEEDMYA
jgi:nitrogen fixation protein NifU and related proteins